MRVTVVCSTARLGGLDITLHGLANQTRKPDLFVLVDEWWHLRFKHRLEARLPFPVLHVFPGFDGFGISRIGRGHNFGALHARDGLVIFMNDWMWVQPDWIERMAGYAERNPGWTLSGAQFRYDLSDVLEIDILTSLRPGASIDGLFNGRQPIFKDYRENLVKAAAPEGLDELNPYFWFGGINDSILVEHWNAIGGTDERYDGAGGGQDIDLAFRASRLGARFAFDPALINHEIRGPAHEQVACHRCPVATRQHGVAFVMQFMADYHKRIAEEGAPVDWRKDISEVLIPGMNITHRVVEKEAVS